MSVGELRDTLEERRIYDNRGTLHYPGDCTDGLLGRIMGPTLLGELQTVVEVSYDETSNVTTARLLPTRQDDIDAAAGSNPLRTTRFDGQVAS